MSPTYLQSLAHMLTFSFTSLEYTSPESLPSPLTGLLQQVDSKSDMWSLGMILHKLLFFRLPYRYASDGDRNTDISGGGSAPVSEVCETDKLDKLEKEVLRYAGCVYQFYGFGVDLNVDYVI